MSGVFISGMGAVSPAGWGVEALLRVLEDAPLPVPQNIERPGWPHPLAVLRVPSASPRPAWATHPRLRRSARISQFAVGAASEALGDDAGGPLGIVFCTMCGCVNYSRRFYDEVLRDPAVASPLLFPETVFNAPASHLSTVFASVAANYTLVGDTGVFLHGLALGAGWLTDGRVDRCLVVAAEEVDWVTADAFRHFQRAVLLAEGAGAVLLTRRRDAHTVAELEFVTDAQPYHASQGRQGWVAALRLVREKMPDGPVIPTTLAGLGEGFSAGVAWQALATLDAVRREGLARVLICVRGAYCEAIGASFTSSTSVVT